MEVKQARIRHEKENMQLAYMTKKWGTKHRRKIQMMY
jgi:hypothetical protein